MMSEDGKGQSKHLGPPDFLEPFMCKSPALRSQRLYNIQYDIDIV